jgi:hypothetical protein
VEERAGQERLYGKLKKGGVHTLSAIVILLCLTAGDLGSSGREEEE